VYHYEYAIYNQNLDRAIQSFSVPLGCGVTVSNLGFHAPLNHPGFPNDGTLGDAGFSNVAWSSNQTANEVNWSTETFAQNQNANAIRWGTLYNFRFDSNHSPLAANATIGFFKTGTPVTVAILGPNVCDATPSPTPTATATATATATSTASPTVTPSATPTASATATPTATPAVDLLNLSTRMLVETGDHVGIGGFIITGTVPKHLILRAIGPSLTVPGKLADPILELHGPNGFIPIINDNWREPPLPQYSCDIAGGIPPGNDLEPCINATLDPGAYTAILYGRNNTSGVALVEVYDIGQTAASKLANISTRAFVSTGSNITIAGFIVGNGSANDNFVLRGIGPSLPVPGVLANPTLELRDGNGALIRSDDNWQDDPAQAALITAAGLAPANNLESGIAATLPPGSYTVLLAGLNNGTGIGLVEVYDLRAP
jgi:hypothetical protein